MTADGHFSVKRHKFLRNLTPLKNVLRGTPTEPTLPPSASLVVFFLKKFQQHWQGLTGDVPEAKPNGIPEIAKQFLSTPVGVSSKVFSFRKNRRSQCCCWNFLFFINLEQNLCLLTNKVRTTSKY